jgi:hypothetical protein
VHGKKHVRTKAFLSNKIDEWAAILKADLDRTIVFA